MSRDETPQPSFSQRMTARVAEQERAEERLKRAGGLVIRSVLVADLATLPAEVAAARREMEAMVTKVPADVLAEWVKQ